MGENNNYNDGNSDGSSSSSSGSSGTGSYGMPTGPLGIDPLHFSIGLFVLLVLYVFYLMLPRALRKQYFGAYPKRHAWSARSRNARRSYGQVRRVKGEKEEAPPPCL